MKSDRNGGNETARERVQAFVDAQHKPRWRNAAEQIGIGEGQLRMWLYLDLKEIRSRDALKVAAFFSLPLECIVCKNEPIAPIVRRLRKLLARDK